MSNRHPGYAGAIPLKVLQRAVRQSIELENGVQYFKIGKVLKNLPYELSPAFDIQRVTYAVLRRYAGSLTKRRAGGWYLECNNHANAPQQK